MRDSKADAALLNGIANGSEAAFIELYRGLGDDVHRLAYALTRSASAAQDITQDVFVSVLEHAERYDAKRGSVRTWLLGCARNIAIDRLRRDTRWCADGPEQHTSCAGEEAVFEQQRSDALLAAIERLPNGFRETLVLCELMELSYAETASITRCPVGTVRSRLHRARAMLAAELGGQESDRDRSSDHAPDRAITGDDAPGRAAPVLPSPAR